MSEFKAVKPRFDIRVYNITGYGKGILATQKVTSFLEDGSCVLTVKEGTRLHMVLLYLESNGAVELETLRTFNYPSEAAKKPMVEKDNTLPIDRHLLRRALELMYFAKEVCTDEESIADTKETIKRVEKVLNG